MVWKEFAVFFFFFSLKHRFPTPSRFQTSFFLLFPPYCLSLSLPTLFHPTRGHLPSHARPSFFPRLSHLELSSSLPTWPARSAWRQTRPCITRPLLKLMSQTRHIVLRARSLAPLAPLALTNLYLVSCVDRIPPSSSIFSLPSYSSFPFHSPPSSTWRSNHQRLVSLLYRLSDLLQWSNLMLYCLISSQPHTVHLCDDRSSHKAKLKVTFIASWGFRMKILLINSILRSYSPRSPSDLPTKEPHVYVF